MHIKKYNAQHQLMATRDGGREMPALTEISLHLHSKTPQIGIIFCLFYIIILDLILLSMTGYILIEYL